MHEDLNRYYIYDGHRHRRPAMYDGGDQAIVDHLIQQAIDNGCHVRLGHCDFVRRSFNPFPGYMDPLIAKKNRADAVLVMLTTVADSKKSKPERKKIAKMYVKDVAAALVYLHSIGK